MPKTLKYKKLEKVQTLLTVIAILSILSSEPLAFAGSYKENLKYDLKRGVKNILGSPAEIAIGFQDYHERAGWPVVRQLGGMLIGTGKMVLRLGSGVVDLGTAWIPGLQKSLPVRPETLF